MAILALKTRLKEVLERPDCEKGCGPATAEMISRGSYVQNICPHADCWYTTPETMAQLINTNAEANHAAWVLPDAGTAVGQTGMDVTAALIQSIRQDWAAAVPVFKAHHWVACDACSTDYSNGDEVIGVSYLDPERLEGSGASFSKPPDQRRFVWITFWLNYCVRTLYNTSANCTQYNGNSYLVAPNGRAAPLRATRREEDGAALPLSVAQITERFLPAITPFRADLEELFGFTQRSEWKVSAVDPVLADGKATSFVRVFVNVGLPEGELIVVCSNRPPRNEPQSLCFELAGVQRGIWPHPRRLPLPADVLALLQRLSGQDALRQKWIQMLANSAAAAEVQSVISAGELFRLLTPAFRISVGPQTLVVSPTLKLSENIVAPLDSKWGA